MMEGLGDNEPGRSSSVSKGLRWCNKICLTNSSKCMKYRVGCAEAIRRKSHILRGDQERFCNPQGKLDFILRTQSYLGSY